MLLVLPLLFGCASQEPIWAVAQASVVPSQGGLEGTQAWTFFTKRWGKAKGDAAFVCARAQTFSGTVVANPEGCVGCLVAYELTYEELGGDCPDDLATDEAYQLPLTMGIGDSPEAYADLDPHPGDSFGWYADLGGDAMEPYGFGWDDALDWGGDAGPPGWNFGQVYTLTSLVAWDLR